MTIYPGDPLTPGIGSTASGQAPDARDSADHPQDPGASDLLRRCPEILAALQGPVVTGGKRGALGLTYHWGGTDAVKVHLAVKSDWSLEARLRRDRDAPRLGLARPMGGARQPPRRLGDGRLRPAHRPGRADERGQGAGRALPPGLAAEADDRLRELGRRGAEPAGLDRMGRDPRRRAGAQGRSLHQHRQQRARLPLAQGNGELQRLVTQAAADVADPQTGVSVARAQSRRTSSPTSTATPDDVEARGLRCGEGNQMPLGAARLRLRLFVLRSSTSGFRR